MSRKHIAWAMRVCDIYKRPPLGGYRVTAAYSWKVLLPPLLEPFIASNHILSRKRSYTRIQRLMNLTTCAAATVPSSETTADMLGWEDVLVCASQHVRIRVWLTVSRRYCDRILTSLVCKKYTPIRPSRFGAHWNVGSLEGRTCQREYC